MLRVGRYSGAENKPPQEQVKVILTPSLVHTLPGREAGRPVVLEPYWLSVWDQKTAVPRGVHVAVLVPKAVGLSGHAALLGGTHTAVLRLLLG